MDAISQVAFFGVLLLVTYSIGAVIERRHFRSLKEREQKHRDMIVITFETLPDDWRVERAEMVREHAQRRAQLQSEIQGLARDRDAFLKEKIAASGGAEDSLDYKLFGAVKDQAQAAGITYEAEAPAL